MPKELVPRAEQLQCFNCVKETNTIVNMPTGCGKTLIAVLALEHFLPQGKGIFIVPTVPLVQQQADVIRKECSHEELSVLELQAGKLSSESTRATLGVCNVLVGTAQMVLEAFQIQLVNMSEVSLLIFDECHNATGGSPMANFMRDVVHRAAKQPRILGLTASFINGSLQDMTERRQNLESLLSATIFCPSSNPRDVEYHKVGYPQDKALQDPKARDFVEGLVQSVLQQPISKGMPVENRKEVVRHSWHVMQELGMHSLVHHLKMGLLPDTMKKFEDFLISLPAPSVEAEVATAKTSAEEAIKDVHAKATALLGSEITDCTVSSKARVLIDLLRTRLRGNRVLIFCEQIVLVSPLVELIAHFTGQGAMAITGTTSMSNSQRKESLETFRTGECNILVCTAAVEEGIDVAECQVVVRFSKVATTKAHIQGAGRARKMGALVYYFENDPKLEEEKANSMRSCAQNGHLSLTAAEMEERQGHKDIDGVHPYWNSAGCEISIFNCVRLVMEYCSMTMKQTFDPEEKMMIYDEEVICTCPRETRKKLVEVIYPSPNGFTSVTLDAVNYLWKDFGLADVADAERIKRWKSKDKEKRRFFYCIAVQLSKDGYINDENKASEEAKRDIPHTCDVWERPSGIRLNSRVVVRKPPVAEHSPGALQAGPPTDNKSVLNIRFNCLLEYCTEERGEGDTKFISIVTLPGGQRFQGLPARAKKDAEQSAAGFALNAAPNATVPATSMLEMPALTNYKGKLNEKYPGEVAYTVVQEPSGFIATVRTPHGCFTGKPCTSKKDAEKSAAQEALGQVNLATGTRADLQGMD